MIVALEAGARMVGALGGGLAALIVVQGVVARSFGLRPPVLVLRHAIERP